MQEILGRGTFVKDDGEWTAKAADQMQPWVSGERRKHGGLRGRGFRKQCGSKGTLARVEQLLSHGQLEGSRSRRCWRKQSWRGDAGSSGVFRQLSPCGRRSALCVSMAAALLNLCHLLLSHLASPNCYLSLLLLMIIINVYEAFVTAGYCAEYFICEINCSGLKHKHITLALSIIFHT